MFNRTANLTEMSPRMLANCVQQFFFFVFCVFFLFVSILFVGGELEEGGRGRRLLVGKCIHFVVVFVVVATKIMHFVLIFSTNIARIQCSFHLFATVYTHFVIVGHS